MYCCSCYFCSTRVNKPMIGWGLLLKFYLMETTATKIHHCCLYRTIYIQTLLFCWIFRSQYKNTNMKSFSIYYEDVFFFFGFLYIFIIVNSLQFMMQNVVVYLLSHLTNTLDTCAIQVTVVLARLNESMALNILLHLFSWWHKVIVPAIHLILPFRPGCVCQVENKTSEAAQTLTLLFESENQNNDFLEKGKLCKHQPKMAAGGTGDIKWKPESLCDWQHNYLRGTQDPNLSGNSDNRSSFILSLTGPRMMMGLA